MTLRRTLIVAGAHEPCLRRPAPRQQRACMRSDATMISPKGVTRFCSGMASPRSFDRGIRIPRHLITLRWLPHQRMRSILTSTSGCQRSMTSRSRSAGQAGGASSSARLCGDCKHRNLRYFQKRASAKKKGPGPGVQGLDLLRRWNDGLVIHPAHASTGRHGRRRRLFFGLFSNHRFGGHQEARN
jgi:hypothetical protein